MADPLISVRIAGLIPSDSGIDVFLGNDEKTFSIRVDAGVGSTIAMLLRGQKRERPLTHDLIDLIFRAFNITVERIVINDLRNDTFFARLTLRAENEVHRKITEIDARPSDCLAIALETKKPIFVSETVWNQVADLSPLLQKMKKQFEEEDEEDEENGKDDK
jgi:bifunctional DNase/RNase